MKNILTFSLIFFSLLLNAAIISVDNNYPSAGDYQTLQAAHDGASHGDTLLLFPSNGIYQGISVTKRLTILGTGFNRNQPGVKNTFLTGELLFEPNSDGSQIIGVTEFDNNRLHIKINADDITVKRCKFTYLTVLSNNNNTSIINNFFDIDHVSNCWSDNYIIRVHDHNFIYISNNIIRSYSSSGCQSQCILASGQNISGEIKNNIVINTDISMAHPAFIAINADASQVSVSNNIIGSGLCYGNFFSYNISRHNTHLGPTNMIVSDLNTVFIDYPQQNYHLSANSPALGSGIGGSDMGIYGGDFPFVDGGYPELPAIYYLDVPGAGNQQTGINVLIKVKSNY